MAKFEHMTTDQVTHGANYRGKVLGKAKLQGQSFKDAHRAARQEMDTSSDPHFRSTGDPEEARMLEQRRETSFLKRGGVAHMSGEPFVEGARGYTRIGGEAFEAYKTGAIVGPVRRG